MYYTSQYLGLFSNIELIFILPLSKVQFTVHNILFMSTELLLLYRNVTLLSKLYEP